MDPADSRSTPPPRVADTLAGACAELVRCEARGQSPSPWVQRLEEIGVRDYIGHMVWRELDDSDGGAS